MAVPTPRQTRSGGGMPLIILGVILALGAGALVLYLTGNGGQSVTVIVASQAIDPGRVLTTDSSKTDDPYMPVSQAFHTEHIPADLVPSDALLPTGTDDWAGQLNGHMTTSAFSQGDILRKQGNEIARTEPVGSGPLNSLTRKDPAEIATGDVLFSLHIDQGITLPIVAGDHLDILASTMDCPIANQSSCHLAQTTLQNVLVYANDKTMGLIIVLSHQDALALKLLNETTKIDLVVRKPDDTSSAGTTTVDIPWLMTHYGFTAP